MAEQQTSRTGGAWQDTETIRCLNCGAAIRQRGAEVLQLGDLFTCRACTAVQQLDAYNTEQGIHYRAVIGQERKADIISLLGDSCDKQERAELAKTRKAGRAKP